MRSAKDSSKNRLKLINNNLVFFKGAQVGGRTWDLFDFRLFSLTRSALDHSATAPPYSDELMLENIRACIFISKTV